MIEGFGNEAAVRVVFTLAAFLILACVEAILPRRMRSISRGHRWLGNLLLQLINAITVRVFFFWLAPVGIALHAANSGYGLLNLVSLPAWVAILIAIIALDLLIYWQHRLMHEVSLLWRLHRVHHADVDVDVTTALRFHPIEIVFSLLLKSIFVALIGAPVEAVLAFAVLLNGMAMFNHANINLPLLLDKKMRFFLVTPDMHRVHHSIEYKEHNSNYGFNLSCWDRLFGSYCAQPKAGHGRMILGLDETNSQQTGSVTWMLKEPFV